MLHAECTSTLDLIDESLAGLLTGIVRGVEKEGLRVMPDGGIAQTPHPSALGSTLTHSSITTDYSEALLEFITPTHSSVDAAVAHLAGLHQFTLQNINDERIWPASMPCVLAGDKSIPIANYGHSNIGMLKHVYRRGLAVRYGRIMQSIAGIHYNFSLPDAFWEVYRDKFYQAKQLNGDESLQDFQSSHYFSLIRNFRRYSWLLHYLFGASPVLDQSFIDGRPGLQHGLQELGDRTWGLPYATSLRMSDLGYQNSAQQDLHISYNSLDEYVQSLGQAIHVPHPPYAELGVTIDGEFQQLNSNILQIENEYYSDIRPKRVTHSSEKPVAALDARGVEYVEVRILDINPFLPEGISAQQMRFMDVFLLHCLFSQCPQQSTTRCVETRDNQRKVIHQGRDPELRLERNGKQERLTDLANELLDDIMQIAEVMDQATDSFDYTAAVYAQKAKVDDPAVTPSGQLMTEVAQGRSFIDIVNELATQHKRHFLSLEQSDEFLAEMQREAAESLARQTAMEAEQSEPFSEFLARYNAA